MKKDSQAVMRCQKRKKLIAIDRFGGKCMVCGYNKCAAALEFHHIENKKESPSYVIHRWSWERARKELEKCVLLCANCHREVHASLLEDKQELLIRRNILPWHLVKCLTCQKEFETKEEEQQFCSSVCFKFSLRKVIRPSKEELEELLKTNSYIKIGKIFGVSDNTIRKWVKYYKIT